VYSYFTLLNTQRVENEEMKGMSWRIKKESTSLKRSIDKSEVGEMAKGIGQLLKPQQLSPEN